MSSEFPDQYGDEPAIGRMLRERLRRYPAPAGLRRAVAAGLRESSARRPLGPAWLAPALAALATGMVMVMWLAPALSTRGAADPIRHLLRAAISEHARTMTWGAAAPDVVPAALPRAMDESGVALTWVFVGDEQLQLLNAHATYIDGHRAMVLAYRGSDGHAVTYLMIPAATLVLPERGRVQAGRWRPLLRRDEGFSLIAWKQQGLLCVLVSDLVSAADGERFKQYFVKLRSSTEPYPTF